MVTTHSFSAENREILIVRVLLPLLHQNCDYFFTEEGTELFTRYAMARFNLWKVFEQAPTRDSYETKKLDSQEIRTNVKTHFCFTYRPTAYCVGMVLQESAPLFRFCFPSTQQLDRGSNFKMCAIFLQTFTRH